MLALGSLTHIYEYYSIWTLKSTHCLNVKRTIPIDVYIDIRLIHQTKRKRFIFTQTHNKIGKLFHIFLAPINWQMHWNDKYAFAYNANASHEWICLIVSIVYYTVSPNAKCIEIFVFSFLKTFLLLLLLILFLFVCFLRVDFIFYRLIVKYYIARDV